MGLSQKIATFRRSRKKYILTLVLAAIVLLLAAYSYWQDSERTRLVYRDSLDREVASVNGTVLTLSDMAFYVAYEENLVEQQALAYDAADTGKYWNMHTDGVFVRVAARNATVQMLVHDELFYQMALAEGITLNADEEAELQLSVQDFWNDLTGEEKEQRLGVGYEVIEGAMRKLMYAQKMQVIYSELNGVSYETFEFYTDSFHALLEEQDVKIKKDVLKRIGFGSVTLDHGKKEN